MDAAMEAVMLPGEIQIVEMPDDEDEESQQTILTAVNEVEWANIPLTIGPTLKLETNLNVEDTVELQQDELDVIEEPTVECKLMSSETVGSTEYVIIAIDEQGESNASQTSDTEPCLLFPDGTVKCMDMENVFLVAQDVEDTPFKQTKPKIFVCKFEDCNRAYSSQHHLKVFVNQNTGLHFHAIYTSGSVDQVHERSHTGERPFKCLYTGCNKEFSRDFSLKSHLRTHTGERPYSCPYFCGKAFKTSGDLQKHTRTHTGERPFLCPVESCGKSFATSNTCRIHIRKHTGEKPYVCQEEGCGKVFSSSTNFKNHMRVHSGEKPYACSVEGCGKAFTEYSSLYKHRNVHEQEKRYRCGYCDKAYRQMTSLTTHKRAVHGVVTSEDGSELVLEQAMENGEEGYLENVTSDLTSDSPIQFKTMDLEDEDYGAVYEIM